ncbi:AAA family ATPase [Romboutsia sp. 1001713B170207_170306_H8]|uniref:AAA family ATPase n=1 Tax=Romboutsia sp. 1001713B170207_170306_H8 TaxID=2787112 RepID=UPI001896DADF|nr:AAA family ATPase [Romboutsia sp. 1001713B170207_170306_H8]
MNIKSLSLNNIISFDRLELIFSSGINIIEQKNIEINTKILKLIYAMYNNNTHIGKCNFDLAYTYFKSNAISLINDKINLIDNKPNIKIVYDDDSYFTYDLLKYEGIKAEINGVDKYYKSGNYKITFIPADDILYNSEEILKSNKDYKSFFDKTYIDIINKSKQNEDKSLDKKYEKILNLISKSIDGIPVYENQNFYIVKEDKYKINLSKESKENRKLALFYLLIKNGFIQKNRVLIWDRPSEYLSKKNIFLLKEILKYFEKEGMQIFISGNDLTIKN